MQFHQLVCFVKVVEKKSFSIAAEVLYLSQSTVSTHISSLEKYFGQKVFDRLGKEINLTPFGEKLYQWAKEILQIRENALWDLKDWTGKIQGNINIAASTVPAQYMVPSIIAKFLKKYPQVKFNLTQESSKKTAKSILKGNSDIGMLGEKYFEDKIKYISYTQEKLVLITPSSLKLKDPVHIEDIIEEPFIFRKAGSGTQKVIEKILKQQNIKKERINIIGYFDSVQSIKHGVKEGIGVAIISEIAARDFQKRGLINVNTITEFKEDRIFYLAYNKQKTLSPLAMEFIKTVIPSTP